MSLEVPLQLQSRIPAQRNDICKPKVIALQRHTLVLQPIESIDIISLIQFYDCFIYYEDLRYCSAFVQPFRRGERQRDALPRLLRCAPRYLSRYR